jgi:hypothetical protein
MKYILTSTRKTDGSYRHLLHHENGRCSNDVEWNGQHVTGVNTKMIDSYAKLMKPIFLKERSERAISILELS